MSKRKSDSSIRDPLTSKISREYQDQGGDEYTQLRRLLKVWAEQHSTSRPHQVKVYDCQLRDGEAKRQIFQIDLKVRFSIEIIYAS
jgi:hypothetical protein